MLSKKIFAVLFISIFLVSTSVCFAKNEPKIRVTVNVLRLETENVKPAENPGKPTKPDLGKPGDYKLMGVSWQEFGLTLYVEDAEMVDEISAAAEEWDNYVSPDLVSSVVFDETLAMNIFDEVESNTPDNVNELVWADLDSGIIAVCYTWWNDETDEIIQFDIAFNNNADYTWGDASSNTALMDLQNIATHELGHGFGLLDLYKPKLNELTMYGYSEPGDIIKRDLAPGDIDGIQALYGAP